MLARARWSLLYRSSARVTLSDNHFLHRHRHLSITSDSPVIKRTSSRNAPVLLRFLNIFFSCESEDSVNFRLPTDLQEAVKRHPYPRVYALLKKILPLPRFSAQSGSAFSILASSLLQGLPIVYCRNMPILLLPQPQRQRLDRLSSTIPDPFISTYLFNQCHSLNPYFHHRFFIRSATNLTATRLSFLASRYSVKYDATPFSYRLYRSLTKPFGFIYTQTTRPHPTL
ncbi:uncharacterized protein EDB91DRAFT_244102 [Suillus paluster]|uniref:uncharacterized protein n=1 Tax=Suillus paluster TaxID=48578 RepID=UPI001B8665F8|nr:uncharacterized protein EDB91DRAFT_244102 [Suillus paluster]KAG1721687.1 hypothetical protein EDB91DRAFT_244102 [Suillus paluster]